ncbi:MULTISPECIES: NAD(P)H-binding protein [unclassified Streptomyces]|jgi:NAD(P)H dehydrogenase (quinone)|uniref:NAD(P)H-binding protein n=1 Tax=unclassified Streptomyces TaxID=2593676 RepID=UPI00368C24B8
MLLVTGVSGALGSLVAERLAGREDVVLGTRAGLPGTRLVDFDDPSTLPDAFAGIDTLLLISAGYGEDDVVVARHEAALSAAERAGVGHVVYTSLSGDGDHLTYALAHRWTERRLQRSTLNWTILRNGLYAEFLTWIATPDADNRITGPLGDGGLAAVARADLADIAVTVATDPAPHAGRVYELVGDRPLGGAELAEALGATYAPVTLAEARTAIAASGAQAFQVPMLTGTYSAIAHGFLDGSGVRSDLRALLGGREPLDALEVFVAAVRDGAAAA